MAKCSNCRNCTVERGEKFFDMWWQCKEGVVELKDVEDIDNFEVECDKFDSKYITYPLTINELILPDEKAVIDGFSCKMGDLVKVRPCADEYKGKTFLGIYLGDMDIGLHASFNRETKVLEIYRHHNPAMYVPAIKKIIYGCESWWGKIKDENELKDITNKDIDNIWYVQLLKAMVNDKAKGSDNV